MPLTLSTHLLSRLPSECTDVGEDRLAAELLIVRLLLERVLEHGNHVVVYAPSAPGRPIAR